MPRLPSFGDGRPIFLLPKPARSFIIDRDISCERNFSSSIMSAGLSLLDRLHLLSRRLRGAYSSLCKIEYASLRDNRIIYSFICKLIAVLAMSTLFINTDSQTQHSSRPDTVIIRLLVPSTELLSSNQPAHGRDRDYVDRAHVN